MKLMRRKNLDASERMQCEKISVASDDVRYASVHGKFEELVVLRITTGRDSHINFDPFRLARQGRQKASNILLIEVSKKLFPTKDFIEFGKRRKGKQHPSFLKSQFECTTRFRIGKEQSTNQHVCIENAAQLRALEERIQNFRCEPAVLRLAFHVIEHLFERRIFPGSQFAKPKAKQRLNLPFLLRPGRVVRLRRLRVQRNRDGRVPHGLTLPPF